MQVRVLPLPHLKKGAIMKLLLLFLISSNLFGYEIIQNKKNKVEFLGDSIMGIVSIPGEGGKIKGQITEKDGMISGDFIVDLTKFKTGMSLRDKHMHENYLETKKYPEAKLTLKPVKLAKEMKFDGMLTIKGQTKPVKGKATFEENLLKSEFKVSLKNYPKIGAPSYGDVAMDDEVIIKVEFEVKK